MIKPEHLPDVVIDAAVAMRDRGGSMSDIIRTAINAWPGMCHAHNENGVNVAWATWYALPWHRANASEGIILPFSENTDAEG